MLFYKWLNRDDYNIIIFQINFSISLHQKLNIYISYVNNKQYLSVNSSELSVLKIINIYNFGYSLSFIFLFFTLLLHIFMKLSVTQFFSD